MGVGGHTAFWFGVCTLEHLLREVAVLYHQNGVYYHLDVCYPLYSSESERK